MEPLRVLLIEDDLELLRQLTRAFVAARYSVTAAADGQDGLARFLDWPADLVVTDIVMPNREGIETIVALRKHSPTVKIIAISGGYRTPPADFLSLARGVGADETLAKPFTLANLLQLAALVLGVNSSAGAA